MRRVLAILLCAAAPGQALAQDDFSLLKLRPGQIVFVTDSDTGVEVSGPLASLAAGSLSIDGYRVEPKAGLKIERAGDSLWNGAAIGFGLGAFVLFPVLPEGERAGAFRPVNGLLWAAIGALIDHEHVGRTTIYKGTRANPSGDALGRSVRMMPDIGPHRQGAALVVRF